MNDPLVLIGLWVVLAFAMAAVPSTDNHWRRAYVLMALGAPLLIWVGIKHGIWAAALGLVIGGLVLRWPVYYLWRWIKRQVGWQQ